METVAAADFYGLIKKYRGAGLGDGIVGFLGAGSSVLIITEELINQVRELHKRDEIEAQLAEEAEKKKDA